MAKGQITEKDLELGVKTAGGFSGLSKVTRRDSPFGVEHAKSTVEEKEKTVEVKVETPKAVSYTHLTLPTSDLV